MSWSRTGHPAEVHITGSTGSVFMADDRFRVWEFDEETGEDETIRQTHGIDREFAGAGAAEARPRWKISDAPSSNAFFH